jgi:anti-sigma-K factor RskA
VLHGLSPEEDALFAEHLATCEECAASVAEHEFVAAQLGSISYYPESEDAPSWESVRAAIITAGSDDPKIVDLSTRRRRYDGSRRVLAAAAVVIVLAGGGIVAWRATNHGTSCSASNGCHVIELDAAAGHTLASVMVEDNAATVTPTSMPTAPAGKTYVLWQLPRNGQAIPITDFTAGSGTSVTGDLRVNYSDTAAFAVSLESAAGAPPSTPSNTLASGAST